MIKMKMKKNLTGLEVISERLWGSDTSPCFLSILQRKDEIQEEEFYELSKTCNRYSSITCSFFLTLMLTLAKKIIQHKLQENIHNETSVYGNLLPQTAQTNTPWKLALTTRSSVK
jgi:hypothetical protein